MELPNKQLSKILNSSNRILLTGAQNPSIDILSSAAAWWVFLQMQSKQVDVIFDGQISKLKFLPNKIDFKNDLSNLNKFKIVLDTSQTSVKQLSYDVKNDKLEINIIPEDGVFESKDVKTERGEYKYDLVISLGAHSLESLGRVFSEHRHFFHQVPLINIDRSVVNENFGEVNIVETASTSLAEISYHALQKYLDKDMATCLLAGMISATNSFQSPQVTPDALSLASQLIIKGADRAKIIECLYRTKDIDTLKNWGKVLSRLQKSGNLLISHLQYDETDKLPQDLQEMVKDLILATPGGQVAMILYQLEVNQTEIWFYSISNINCLELTSELGASGDRQFCKLVIDKDLERTRELISRKIQDKLNIINSA